jgi:hypothetical protein
VRGQGWRQRSERRRRQGTCGDRGGGNGASGVGGRGRTETGAAATLWAGDRGEADFLGTKAVAPGVATEALEAAAARILMRIVSLPLAHFSFCLLFINLYTRRLRS